MIDRLFNEVFLEVFNQLFRINQLNNEKRDGTEEDGEGPPPEKKVAKTPENNDDKSN